MAYILAIDLGSSQMKLMVMDERANAVLTVSRQYPTTAGKNGWLEQAPGDWEAALKSGIAELKERVSLDKIEVISLSGHMSAVVLLDGEGEVLCPCIMLSDARSQKQSEKLSAQMGDSIRQYTGNPVNNAFSLPKLVWLKEQEPGIFRRTKVWLSPKDYLRFRLTDEIWTDYTDAYNSLCLDASMEWREEIIEGAGLRREIFPEIVGPADLAGTVSEEGARRFGLKEGTPVAAGAADMACAALGLGMAEPGDTGLTLGTCATFLSVVPERKESCYGQVTFHPHVTRGKFYALGSHFNGGAAVNWISEILSEEGRIDYAMIGRLSKEAEGIPAGSRGLLTIPFLVGSGSPYFCPSDRAHMIGLRAGTSRGEIFRSQLEGITYNMRQTLRLFQETGQIQELILAGGGIHVAVWPKIITDVFGIPVCITENPDVSTVGAALIGGAAAGIFENLEETAARRLEITERRETDQRNFQRYRKIYERYLRYYEMMHSIDAGEQKDERDCL